MDRGGLELVKRNFTPQSQVDHNKAALDTATGRVMQAKAALTQAQVNLDYTGDDQLRLIPGLLPLAIAEGAGAASRRRTRLFRTARS